MAVEFYIAKMSDHMETAQILKWLVKEGDRVEQYQIILELMTDKVTAEVEAPAAGVIKGIRPGAVDGATVPVGEAICYIAAADEVVPALAPLPGYEATDEGRTIAEHRGRKTKNQSLRLKSRRRKARLNRSLARVPARSPGGSPKN